MPYITADRRADLYSNYCHRDFPNDLIVGAGELNFVLTKICLEYFQSNGGRYQQINDIIGALEGCKLEFYRKLVSKYEDKKAIENGEVY
jgi:hypothetical protein